MVGVALQVIIRTSLRVGFRCHRTYDNGNIGVRLLQVIFRMAGRHIHTLCDLLIDQHVNPDSLLGLALQNSVDPPFGVASRGTPEVEFRREPPVYKRPI